MMAQGFHIKLAATAWEKRGAAALRRDVFCTEQRLFPTDDTDEIDTVALPIVALSLLGMATEEVVGTVRIHQAGPGLWWGSRLAVARPHRRAGALGPALIRLAVGTARARGATCFLAHVQAQNAPLFEKLHWRTEDILTLHGHPHHRMRADLAFYPPAATPDSGFLAWRHAA